VFLVVCRFFVGFGVTGLYTVDIAVVQEFVPASRRGWITGVTTTMLPAGFVLGALLGQYAEAYIGWRGMFAIGLLPAGLSLLTRLGSGIAALAHPPGPPRGGAPIPRLGADGRPEGNPAARGRSAGREGCLARIVQISAERRGRLSRRSERDRHHRVPVVAGHAVRHGPAHHASAGLGSGDLAEPRTDRRALLLLMDLGRDGAAGFNRPSKLLVRL
jgi:Major Facilitator Superfamily